MALEDHLGTSGDAVWVDPRNITVDAGVQRALIIVAHRRENLGLTSILLNGIPASHILYSGNHVNPGYSSFIGCWLEDDLPPVGVYAAEPNVWTNLAYVNLHDVPQDVRHTDPADYALAESPVTLYLPDVGPGQIVLGALAGGGSPAGAGQAMTGQNLAYFIDGHAKGWINGIDDGDEITATFSAESHAFVLLTFEQSAPPARRRSPLLLLPY